MNGYFSRQNDKQVYTSSFKVKIISMRPQLSLTINAISDFFFFNITGLFWCIRYELTMVRNPNAQDWICFLFTDLWPICIFSREQTVTYEFLSDNVFISIRHFPSTYWHILA